MRILIITAILLATVANQAKGAFSIPERLVFDISWSGISAGTAVQEVTRTADGISIVSTARSADWLSVFFTVDDRIEAIMAKGEGQQLFGKPRIYREKIREGRTRFHKEVTFDQSRGIATIVNHLEKKESTLPITPITFDSLSCFYYARLQRLDPGSSFSVDVFDGKKLHKTEVKVLRRETVETELGTFKTIVIMPVLRTQTIFSKQGDLFIWLTDDDRRIPVKLQSKVKIGSFKALLVEGSYWPKKK